MKRSIFLITIFSVLFIIVGGCASSQPEEPVDANLYKDISVQDAKELIDATPELVIIDVSSAYADGHLPNALNYPLEDGSLDEAIPTFALNLTYLVYCHTDEASMAGAQKLVDAGFENVYRLDGNYSGWVDAGFDTSLPEEPVEAKMYTDLSAKEAKGVIDVMPKLVIIDVSPAYADGHLPNALNYPIEDGSLEQLIPMLDLDLTYLVYSHTDEASMAGAQRLVDAGIENVYRLDGNYSGWIDAGFEIMK